MSLSTPVVSFHIINPAWSVDVYIVTVTSHQLMPCVSGVICRGKRGRRGQGWLGGFIEGKDKEGVKDGNGMKEGPG